MHGETLLVAPGLYLENVDYRGKSLLLCGRDGAEATVLASASAQDGIVRLEGLTVSGAQDTAPEIHVDGTSEAFLQVRRCIVRDDGVRASWSSTTAGSSREPRRATAARSSRRGSGS